MEPSSVEINNYLKVRKKLISNSQLCNFEKLVALKSRFKTEINSVRRLECIQDLVTLVHILEVRDVIAPPDTSVLEEILALLNIHQQAALPSIVQSHPSTVPSNVDSQHTYRVLNFGPSNVRDRIYELICEEIGSKWKHLARNLKIKEGKIDELESAHTRTHDRVHEVLLYYERYQADSNWFKLLDALSLTRRNDLCIEIKEILSNQP